MNLRPHIIPVAAVCDRRANDCRTNAPRLSASVLIVVMWIAFGVVAMALYFSHSMEMNLRAADSMAASYQADAAIEAAALYYSNVLAVVCQANTSSTSSLQNNITPFMLPPTMYYKVANVPLGEASWWVIGRDTNDSDYSRRSDAPAFGLVDEAAFANLNNTKLYVSPDSTNSTNYLRNLPGMTFQLLCDMYDWETTNTTATSQGAKSQTYEGLNPPYMCKLTNFDTVGELRMVYNMNLDLEYGEDINLNSALDPNKNDGQARPPNDNGDGKLDPGFLSFFTVYTHEPTNLGTTNRYLVSDMSGFTNFLATNNPSVLTAIAPKLRTMGTVRSVLEFALKSGITEQQFVQIEPFLMSSSNAIGLINVNTASAAVMGTLPGIGTDGTLGGGSMNAQTIVSYRQSNQSRLNSIYWLIDALSGIGSANVTNLVTTVGPWVTSRSWQYSADIAAVGRYGRGYRRVKFVYDCSSGLPQIVYRQDLTYLGWALGRRLHDQLIAGTLR